MFIRLKLMLAAILVVAFAGAGSAQDATTTDPATEAPWQASITGQIEAFRAGDGAGALSFAGAGFRAAFDDPAVFVNALSGGYSPIINSRTHSFGDFRIVGEGVALQEVNIVGPDLKNFEALYQMRLEEEGWRVWGVQMRAAPGVTI
ncbi:DUF4864 domain-containing protein [Cucumibacter marinus]|uniref:DUF4864 domain-containing protein n=1 Tax=Cucumibacter marinus TaxID=1121252 RepID=UPI00040F7592|nr:DUF4864 domain-containing protein [Cucumibacter marinus]